MSMVKVIGDGAYTYDEPVVQQIKLSSRGLLGSDYAGLEKRASTKILHDLDELREKTASDEILIHMLAIGATEDYGANRNGDGFRRRTCQEYHPTFEKHAFFYRNHQNKDPKKSYGRVIKSAWNDRMKRIELVAALNASPAAAKRNNGLVADVEMEKLAQGKDIPVSMACSVPYDICSYCGNKAIQAKDYCSGTHQGGMCKAGGLRDNMGALVEIDGGVHQLHADNPYPKFFDISNVFRPADRIAYVMGTLEKRAALNSKVLKSAELAEQLGIVMPCAMLLEGCNVNGKTSDLVKIAYRLADMEDSLAASSSPSNYLLAMTGIGQNEDNEIAFPEDVKYKFASVLGALSAYNMCLPLTQFIGMTTGVTHKEAAESAAIVRRELPGIYTRMLESNDFVSRIADNPYTPSQMPNVAHTDWAIKLASDYSLLDYHAKRRITKAALHNTPCVLHDVLPFEKTAASNDAARRMAEEFALYKLAFLGAIPDNDPDFPLTANLVLLQNYA